MKKLSLLLSAAVVSTSMLLQSTAAGATDRNQLHPYFLNLPPRNIDPAAMQAQSDSGATIPTFTAKVTSGLDGHTYTYEMLGTSPFATPASTSVHYVPILVRVHFSNGDVLDPTKPGCNDTISVAKRFFGSPLFQNASFTSNGVNVGTTQFFDAFQRANFWTTIGGSNSFHVLLAQGKKPTVVDFTAPAGSQTQAGVCSGKNHVLGEVDINAWDNFVQTLNNKYATTTQVPVVASYNVVLTSGGCCIIGYHNAYQRSGGTQVYSVGAYTDKGVFGSGIADMYAWSHEIGELGDDPFINNGTPAWGHTGQVGGCQNNLEVGDPLTGASPPVTIVLNGFTYHLQELAFYSWFYRVPATGTGGKFSFSGTFTSAQGTC